MPHYGGLVLNQARVIDVVLGMNSRCEIQRRPGGGGFSGSPVTGSPAMGAQSRRRKMAPRPADYKLQIIIIGSRGVGKTSLMERFTDDTFCEACKSTVGKELITSSRSYPRSFFYSSLLARLRVANSWTLCLWTLFNMLSSLQEILFQTTRLNRVNPHDLLVKKNF